MNRSLRHGMISAKTVVLLQQAYTNTRSASSLVLRGTSVRSVKAPVTLANRSLFSLDLIILCLASLISFSFYWNITDVTQSLTLHQYDLSCSLPLRNIDLDECECAIRLLLRIFLIVHQPIECHTNPTGMKREKTRTSETDMLLFSLFSQVPSFACKGR